jgi:hypothetical protein
MKRILVVLALLAPSPPSAPPSDPSDIMRRSIAANHRDLSAAMDFDYSERRQTPEGSKTYAVTMLNGSPYQGLVAINDKPLSNEDRLREDKKKDAARVSREREDPGERAVRLAKYERERRRNRTLLDQVGQAFNVAREANQTIDGVEAYVLKATPRPDYRPPSLEAEVLTGVESRFWIEQSSFHWVKVEATVVRPVSIAAFVAKVEPGTQFMLEQTEVGPGMWLPKRFLMRTRARILFMFKQHTQLDATYFGYQRATGALGGPEARRP